MASRLENAETASAHVLILLATYNGERFLAEQLDSIARQTHSNWTLLVGDDGSTDSTLEIVERFSSEHPGRVRVRAEPRLGSARDNFFSLMRSAPDADYVAFSDQDDVWADSKLETLLGECASAQGGGPGLPCLAYSDLKVVGSDLSTISQSFMDEMRTNPDLVTFGSNLVENSIPGCSLLINRSLMREFLAYDGPLGDAIMHDWWLALIGRGLGTVTFVPEPLVLYRQHDSNSMGSVHRSGLRFMVSKMVSAEPGSGEEAHRQAMLFREAYGLKLDPDNAAILSAYSDFPRLGKLGRAWRCIRLGLLKQTLSRRVYQLVRI